MFSSTKIPVTAYPQVVRDVPVPLLHTVVDSGRTASHDLLSVIQLLVPILEVGTLLLLLLGADLASLIQLDPEVHALFEIFEDYSLLDLFI